jgi:DNA-binding transcriptional regulator GbsR (MarR family)
MTRSLSEEVGQILNHTPVSSGPLTLASLARHFGVSNALMSSCAQEMIGRGVATPAYVNERGVQTLHGLLPPAPAAAS